MLHSPLESQFHSHFTINDLRCLSFSTFQHGHILDSSVFTDLRNPNSCLPLSAHFELHVSPQSWSKRFPRQKVQTHTRTHWLRKDLAQKGGERQPKCKNLIYCYYYWYPENIWIVLLTLLSFFSFYMGTFNQNMTPIPLLSHLLFHFFNFQWLYPRSLAPSHAPNPPGEAPPIVFPFLPIWVFCILPSSNAISFLCPLVSFWKLAIHREAGCHCLHSFQ